MQRVDGRIIYSASDVTNFLACGHLITLELKALDGDLRVPDNQSPQAKKLKELGFRHERAHLDRLRGDGHEVVCIDETDLSQAVQHTLEAMRSGASYIYQAAFLHDGWRGHADFLRRVSGRSALGDFHYEIIDAKLARRTEPYFLVQLCNYNEHIGRIQDYVPEYIHILLGDSTEEKFRVSDYSAYYRAVKRRFLERMGDAGADTYPVPVPHCSVCVWNDRCQSERKRDDHLSLVANMTRLQTARLNSAGISTMAQLAAANKHARPREMEPRIFEKLKRQARLQDAQRQAESRGDTNPYMFEILPTAEPLTRGFALLPRPSAGDIFFDMEGDPYYEISESLEYLFGVYCDDGFVPFWGCDRSISPNSDRLAEKRAFEAFIDFVFERRRLYPDLHVYHYANYEKRALGEIARRHGAREDEVDILLREDVLVDLYRVVRQSIAVGQPGYSIKDLEVFFGKRGDGSTIKGGDESIYRFEEWLSTRRDATTRDDSILDDLETYNKYDCVSTKGLRDWLLSLKQVAERQWQIEIPFFAGAALDDAPRKTADKYADLKSRLAASLPTEFDPDVISTDHAAKTRWFAMQMLEYHWREDKPVYWHFHNRCGMYQEMPDDLYDDSESVYGLQFLDRRTLRGATVLERYRFPTQQLKVDNGDCFNPKTKKNVGKLYNVEDGDEFGVLTIEREPRHQAHRIDDALVIRNIVHPGAIRDALARLAEAILDGSVGRGGRYCAAFDLLRSSDPRLRYRPAGVVLQPNNIENEQLIQAVVDDLDNSYLFIQGPPGCGKTYTGARLITTLLNAGKRVGIMANSHKAIHNLLDEIEKVALERDCEFVGVKKSTKDRPETQYNGRFVTSSTDSFESESAQLYAGTAWAFGSPAMDGVLDYLFIDEAGQVALPNAIAATTAARNVVLMGDPLQLSHVKHGKQPGGVGKSILEHLLGEEMRPVEGHRGILLTSTYRMHPLVCGFVSDILYESKLHSAKGREKQAVRTDGGGIVGLRFMPVTHSNERHESIEEAHLIAKETTTLLDGWVTDYLGRERRLTPADIIVVTPYNLQVRCIKRELRKIPGGDAVEVGTVDKFQGKQAYVVFFSTAASSPDDIPRGLDFLFDLNRLNVAISRARALAIWVGSPELLHAIAGSVEDARRLNAVAHFMELAHRQIGVDLPGHPE